MGGGLGEGVIQPLSIDRDPANGSTISSRSGGVGALCSFAATAFLGPAWSLPVVASAESMPR
jgi:hypothetical protein